MLHTWGRNLSQHIHLHCIVTGGALTADGSRFIRSRRAFLFPVRALSMVFRAKYLEVLQQAFRTGQLDTPGQHTDAAAPPTVCSLLTELKQRDWIVYCKPPLAGPQQVLDYLGRYTHRVAISNDRLVSFHAAPPRPPRFPASARPSIRDRIPMAVMEHAVQFNTVYPECSRTPDQTLIVIVR